MAGPGEIIVINNNSNYVAPWGELASHGCAQKGIAGVVIDGAIRDVDEIRRMKFPAFASAIVPNAGEPKGFGEIIPGFYVQPRTLRKYSKPVASHLLGYVSEVDDGIVKKDPYYKQGDYIGKSGIEESYEKELRGKRGVKIYLVDVYSRIKGSYAGGNFDTVAVQGDDIISGIDLNLQEYGELLMKNKRGSIVAIEPKTGEVLTLVSAPDYDPGLLVGRIRSDNFSKLSADTLKPLFNRALMASYPPGSTFKPINGLIALQEQVITS